MAKSILSAQEIINQCQTRTRTVSQVAQSALDAIDRLDSTIDAWASLDRNLIRDQARALDGADLQDMALAGVPIGIKDIIDTCDQPTQRGSAIAQGRQPDKDAFLIRALRSAGAQILGKTVTTEFAFLAPSKTKNPHNDAFSPGGSSSGSAAAVAAGMVPVAIGTQTNGSMIRPGSYCGVLAFKPSHGGISRQGVLQHSWWLDTMGIYARNLMDLALCGDVLMQYDRDDDAMAVQYVPHLQSHLQQSDARDAPKIGFVKTPVWHLANNDTKRVFDDARQKLGDCAFDVTLPDIFDNAHDDLGTLMLHDIAQGFAQYDGNVDLSPQMQMAIDQGKTIDQQRYQTALANRMRYIQELANIFDEYDAIFTPSATGAAPKGFASTGNPCFCTIWTLCGVPAINLPIGTANNGLPLGLQLVGPYQRDGELLRNAKWILQQLPLVGLAIAR